MEILWWILLLLIFMLGTAVVGMLATWIDRKVTARVQYRVGPPWFQPFADFVKLLGKETIVPNAASKAAFLISPLIGLAGAAVASVLIGSAIFSSVVNFPGDLIVIIYVLLLPALGMILGGLASANPLSSIGASREMKLAMAYELPFILMIAVVLVKMWAGTNMSDAGVKPAEILSLGSLTAVQQQSGAFVCSISGLLALIVAVLCTQAKLGQVPFDAAEAETELTGGILVEYCGTPLAMYKLTRAMLYVIVPLFVIFLLCGGISANGWSILWGVLKYVGLLVLVVLIRNTNPRLRIEHAVKFFWGPVTALAVIAVALAVLGASLKLSWL